MTSPRHPQDALRAAPFFASSRPGQMRRDQVGWVSLHHASRDLLGSARKMRGAFRSERPDAREAPRRSE